MSRTSSGGGRLDSTSSVPYDCEQQGLAYLAGYLAHSFAKEHPEYGKKTHELGRINHAADNTPHITALSHGGLVKPADFFLQKVVYLENVFRQVHNNQPEHILKENTLATTVKQMQDAVELPPKVIDKYARTRLHIRVKHLNESRKEQGTQKARNAAKVVQFSH